MYSGYPRSVGGRWICICFPRMTFDVDCKSVEYVWKRLVCCIIFVVSGEIM